MHAWAWCDTLGLPKSRPDEKDLPWHDAKANRIDNRPRVRPADILKIWPEREPVQHLRPEEFNPIVDQLALTQCGDGI